VPDKCTLTIDCRYIPEKNVAKEKIKLFQMIGRFCHKAKIEYEITRTITIEGYVSQHPAIDKLNHIYQKITKEKSGKFVVMGSTDVSEWTKNLKLAHFGIGVMREDTNIHGVNEFCYVKDIENLSLTIEEFLRGQEELK
jgi:acetylornithine deacetylase/succinyl-diaminopimelate desuccinylase-like protein